MENFLLPGHKIVMLKHIVHTMLGIIKCDDVYDYKNVANTQTG